MRTTDKFVFFYRNADIYSNFYKSEFTKNGIAFSCGEQWIMYQKALTFKDKYPTNQDIADKILKTNDPGKIKAFGRQVQGYDEIIWSGCRQQKTYEGLIEKFRQNENLKKQILATGTRELVEASPSDKIWGVGLTESDVRIEKKSNWKGQNILGKILTKVRSTLQNEAKN
jgi:ribA/ribD-fused uncharacterized protein